MSSGEPIKVKDWQSLQLEKQRMKAICELKEAQLKNRWNELRENYPQMALNALLPFEKNTREKISGGLDWFNNNIIGLFLPGGKNSTNSLPKNFLKIAQLMVISMSYNFFKNLLGKKKKKNP